MVKLCFIQHGPFLSLICRLEELNNIIILHPTPLVVDVLSQSQEGHHGFQSVGVRRRLASFKATKRTKEANKRLRYGASSSRLSSSIIRSRRRDLLQYESTFVVVILGTSGWTRTIRVLSCCYRDSWSRFGERFGSPTQDLSHAKRFSFALPSHIFSEGLVLSKAHRKAWQLCGFLDFLWTETAHLDGVAIENRVDLRVPGSRFEWPVRAPGQSGLNRTVRTVRTCVRFSLLRPTRDRDSKESHPEV